MDQLMGDCVVVQIPFTKNDGMTFGVVIRLIHIWIVDEFQIIQDLAKFTSQAIQEIRIQTIGLTDAIDDICPAGVASTN